jgi:prepilin-type processing-associated H-X9-DG protein
MNGWVGTTHAVTDAVGLGASSQAAAALFQTFLKESDNRFPSQTWYLIDENELSINDGFFFVDMTRNTPWADKPATRHNRGYVISFCDGHSEVYKLIDPRSAWPTPPGVLPDRPLNPDLTKLMNVTTRRN